MKPAGYKNLQAAKRTPIANYSIKLSRMRRLRR